MAQFEINPSAAVPTTSWASVTPDRIDHSVPPPPANRHIVLESTSPTIVETSTQFVKYGESKGIRNINDRHRLLRLFDDFKGNSGADNRDEFSRVLFELSRNQKLFRVLGGVTIDWNDVGSSAKRTYSRDDSRSVEHRDTRDIRRDIRDPRDTRRDTRDIRDPRDTRRDTRDTRDDIRRDTRDTRRNYERDYVRHERPRDNEDPRDRRISELMRTIDSMERTMERLQYRLDSMSNGTGKY
jgi:hypothetical protein